MSESNFATCYLFLPVLCGHKEREMYKLFIALSLFAASVLKEEVNAIKRGKRFCKFILHNRNASI